MRTSYNKIQKTFKIINKIKVETVKKETRTQQIIELSFGEFIRNYKKDDIYMVNEVPFFL